MSIKDLPHVTVEQVLALRAAAIELENDLATARQEATAYRISLENLEDSLPKIKADAWHCLLSKIQPYLLQEEDGEIIIYYDVVLDSVSQLEAGE